MSLESLTTLAVQTALEAGLIILGYYGQHIEPEYKPDNSLLTIADRKSNEHIEQRLAGTGFPLLSEESRQPPYEERKEWTTFWLVDPLDGTKEFISGNGEFTVNIALVHNCSPVIGVIYAPAEGMLYFASSEAGAFCNNSADISAQSLHRIMDNACRLPYPDRDDRMIIVVSRSHMDSKTLACIENLRAKNPGLVVLHCGSSLKFCMVASGEASIYPRFSPTMEWDTAAGHAILNAAGKTLIDADNGSELVYNRKDLRNPGFIAR